MNHINFFNTELIKSPSNKNKYKLFISLYIILISIVLYYQFKQVIKYNKSKNEYLKLLNEHNKRKENIEHNKKALQKQKLLKLEYDKIKEYGPTINSLLLLISDNIPNDVKLSNINFIDKKEVELKGSTRNISELTAFVQSISTKKLWSDINLEKVNINHETKELDFIIKITLI